VIVVIVFLPRVRAVLFRLCNSRVLRILVGLVLLDI
jgi:hypothetical protein